MSNRIKFISTWFGPFPSFVPYWVMSIRQHPDVDVTLFTDQVLEDPPSNLKVVTLPYYQYRRIIENAVGINIPAHIPYKICDTRPAMGIYHAEEFVGYDWIGWLDLDILVGDVYGCLPDNVLDRYDVYSSSYHICTGSFFLIRNLPEYNELYKDIPNFKRICEDEQPHALDERIYVHRFTTAFKHGKAPTLLNGSVPPKWRSPRYHFVDTIALGNPFVKYTDDGAPIPEGWYYKEGKVKHKLHDNLEFPYLNLYRYKQVWSKGVVHYGLPDGSPIEITTGGILPL